MREGSVGFMVKWQRDLKDVGLGCYDNAFAEDNQISSISQCDKIPLDDLVHRVFLRCSLALSVT